MTINKTIQKILAVGGLVGALAACGDKDKDKEYCSTDSECKGDRICGEEGYCVDASGGSSSGSSSNPCGNSPVYGKHLWDISECRLGLYMNTDCTVGSSKPPGYTTGNYSYKDRITYNHLELTYAPEGHDVGIAVLHPDFRFSEKDGSNWQGVNQKLDEYGGYVALQKGSEDTDIDDNALIPLDKPIPHEKEDCKSSIYYAGE